MSLMELAVSMLSLSEKRLEVSAQNISNMNSNGFKGHVAFQALLDTTSATPGELPQYIEEIDFSPGKLVQTDNQFDIAIGGPGFFQLRSGDDVRYTRNGHFKRDADGRLVNGDGFALQAGGQDIILESNDVKVLSDGTVLNAGEPIARISVRDFAQKAFLKPVGGNAYQAPATARAMDVVNTDIRQGALETSNVSTEHEMVAMMGAIRMAEMGQRTVQLYDELTGRAAESFSGRGQ